MARRKKHRKHRGRAKHSNPHRKGRRHGRRRHRRNPGLSLRTFSPGQTIKSVAGIAVPAAIGYYGTNLVHSLLKRFVLDRFLGSQSAGVQAAADFGGRLLISAPLATLVGSRISKGRGNVVALAAGVNVVVNAGRAVADHVPGLPPVVSATLSDWGGGPAAYKAAGVYGFMKPPASGVSNFLAPSGGGKPTAAAQGGRAFL
jgi:hypothetical protein